MSGWLSVTLCLGSVLNVNEWEEVSRQLRQWSQEKEGNPAFDERRSFAFLCVALLSLLWTFESEVLEWAFFFFSFLIHGRKGQRRCAPWELYQSPYALIWYLSRAHIDGREITFSTTGLFSFAHDGEREESVGSRMGKKVHDMSLQKKKVSISLCCRRVGTKHGPLNLGPHLDPHLDPHLGPLLDPLSGSPSGPLFFPENTGSLF